MDENKIDSYLFDEMTESEREQFENDILTDEDLFYAVASRENELIDSYAIDELVGDLRQKFETGLASNPARSQKITNAKVLREFFSEQKQTESKTITIAERSSFFSNLFSFRSPALQFGSIAAILLLSFAVFVLLVENRRLGSIQTDLAAARARETELSARIENAEEASGDLTAELDAERLRIAELEKEIAELRNEGPKNTPTQPTIATLVLIPMLSRDGSPPPAKRLELDAGVARLSIVIILPPEIGSTVSVKLNGETIANNVRVRTRQNEKTVSVIVPITRIKDQRNAIGISDSNGTHAVEYPFTTSRK